jgi:ATP-binding protein involved in chromosome partitioning
MEHRIAIVAGKGGVGKSTVAVQLAHCFQEKGYRMGLLDADLYGPSLRVMLPEEIAVQPHPEKEGVLLPAKARGIALMSMAYFTKAEAAVSVRAPIANSLIKQFIHQVEWGALDCLFVDFPPGTGDIQLTLLQEAGITGAIVVATPQEVALSVLLRT